MKTIQDIANAIKKKNGFEVSFEVDGVEYRTFCHTPTVEMQNTWAIYHATKDRILQEANEKAQK